MTCMIFFIVLLLVTVFLNISMSFYELKISHYDTDIPVWLIAITSLSFSAFFISNVKLYMTPSLTILLFFFSVICVSTYMVASNLAYVVDQHLAFSKSSEKTFRTIPLIARSTESHKGSINYIGVINNNGYVALLNIREPLYQLIGASPNHPCVGLVVQKNGQNERILFSHNVLDVSDVVRC